MSSGPQYGHRVHGDLAALVAEFIANNAAGAASCGDLVAKFTATGGTGRRVRRVRHGLVAWSQSSQSSLQPGRKVAGGSQEDNHCKCWRFVFESVNKEWQQSVDR